MDSFGFTELPEFIHERLRLQEVSNTQDVKETVEEKGEEKEYLLEWQWLFAGGNDILDTKIGSAADLEYRVIVMIHAEQTTS